MEFFERAHVAHSNSSKMDKRSEITVKKQLKQMLHAYKTGNNQEIKSFADTEHKYDADDMKSVSDFSDVSFPREAGTSQETVSSCASENVLSTGTSNYSNERDSSKSNISLPESSDSLESVSQYEEELKSLSSSQDISTTDKDFSSMFESSILSEDYSNSDISIPSSLQTCSDDSDNSVSETFDPDGTLAHKILEKLDKNLKQCKKRKLDKNDKSSHSKKEKTRQAKESLPIKEVKKEIKTLKKTPKSTDFTTCKVLRASTKNEASLTYRDIEAESSEESFQDNEDFGDSQSSENSMQFISVSASDMQSQSLSDIIGDYVHPTIRNLPTDKHNIVHSHCSKYAILDEVINDDNIEDISSIVPEIDEDLAIEDLTLETDTQEPTEESTPYDDTVQTEDYLEQEPSTDNIESQSVPVKVYSCRNGFILTMKHPAELFVHGKIKVTSIGGAVEVFGYTLQDESIDLYAPYCSFAQSIKTTENVSAFHGLFSQLSSAGLTTSEVDEIIRTITEKDAVIALTKLNSPKMDFVDNNFNLTELFTKRVDHTPLLLKRAAESLRCSLYLNKPKRVFQEKSIWEQVVAHGKNSQSRGIICGGKGTGKSTLLRYCANRLLDNGPVLVIDLDPGQAEFTIPGNISATVVNRPLIGPNFTHMMQPEKMLNIGMINTMDNISRYIGAVKELIMFCQSMQSFHSMPWIVNTMGMCNNIGLKFISYIIIEVQPTYVYQIDSKIPKKRFEFELQSHAVSNFYEEHMKWKLFKTDKDLYSLDYTFILGLNEENGVSPQRGPSSVMMPKDERYLNVLAYFGQMLDIYRNNILDIVPYEVDIHKLNIGVNVKIPEQAVMKVINGKIIALCQLATADKGKAFTLEDKALLCHGYGLIRSINFEKGLLYILSPVNIEELTLVNTLLYADWMPELQQEKELPKGTVVPYRSATVFLERGLMFPPKRRFNPIQLLKATRSA